MFWILTSTIKYYCHTIFYSSDAPSKTNIKFYMTKWIKNFVIPENICATSCPRLDYQTNKINRKLFFREFSVALEQISNANIYISHFPVKSQIHQEGTSDLSIWFDVIWIFKYFYKYLCLSILNCSPIHTKLRIEVGLGSE